MAAFNPRPFSFADLDEPRAAEEEKEAPPPVYTEEEMAQALTAARAQGVQEGRRAAEDDAARRRHAIIEAATDRMLEETHRLLDEVESQGQALSRHAFELALAITGRVLPDAARRHALGEIEAVIANALEDRSEQPRLVLRIAEELFEDVRDAAELAAAQRGFEGRLIVLAETGMAAGDIRIEWADGGIERRTAAMLDQVRQIAERFGAAGPSERAAGSAGAGPRPPREASRPAPADVNADRVMEDMPATADEKGADHVGQ